MRYFKFLLILFFLFPLTLIAAPTWQLDRNTYLRTDPQVTGHFSLTQAAPYQDLHLHLQWFFLGAKQEKIFYQENHLSGRTNSQGQSTIPFDLPIQEALPSRFLGTWQVQATLSLEDQAPLPLGEHTFTIETDTPPNDFQHELSLSEDIQGLQPINRKTRFLRTDQQIVFGIRFNYLHPPTFLRGEIYRPDGQLATVLLQTDDPYDLGLGGITWWEWTLRNSPAAQTQLGTWTAHFFIDTGNGWKPLETRTFLLTTDGPRYAYHATPSRGIQTFQPYQPIRPGTTFYTSEAQTNSLLCVPIGFDYYHQDPGIAVQLLYTYWEELPGGIKIPWKISVPFPPDNSTLPLPNQAYFTGSMSHGWSINFLTENNYLGTWDVDILINDLKLGTGFHPDRKLTFTLQDDVPPTVQIQTPDHQTTSDPTIALAGKAQDDVGVVKLEWKTSQGDQGELQGEDLEQWLFSAIPLAEGENQITVIAYDQAHNASSPQSLTVVHDQEAEDACFQVFAPGTDPVDAYTGSQQLDRELLKVRGRLPLTFTLTYDSRHRQESSTGKGWEDKYYAAHLEEEPSGDIKVFWSPHRWNRFLKQPDGRYQAHHSSCRADRLEKQTDGSYLLTRKTQQRYRFNAQGQLLELQEASGATLVFSYDENARLERVTEPVSGVFLAYHYTPEGLLEQVTDPLERAVHLDYDDQHRIVEWRDVGGYRTRYTYDERDRIMTAEDESGHVLFHNVYDSRGQLTEQRQAGSEPVSLTYRRDNNTRLTTVTNRLGQSRDYTFNSSYHLLQVKDELGKIEARYTYDDQGQRRSMTDALDRTTRFDYDAAGHLTRITDAAGHQTQRTYDAHHHLLSVKNALGESTYFSYDAQGRLVTMTNSLQQVTRYTYDTEGQLIRRTEPGDRVTQYRYERGYPVQITLPEGQALTFTYDAAGRLTQMRDAENQVTSWHHDDADRVTTLTDPLGQSVHWTYNRAGQKLSFTDARGQVTRWQYDALGNLISQVNALDQETRYTYDAENRLSQVTDAKGNVTKLAYDAKGRLVEVTNPLGFTQSWRYDAADRQIQQIDALGQEVKTFQYDQVDNVTQVTDALDQEETFKYDALKRLLQVTDALQRVTRFDYDALNRLVASVDALGKRSEQAFNEGGDRHSVQDPGGHQTQLEWDRSGRLIKETWATGKSVHYGYNRRDLLTEIVNGRGQNRKLEYDAAGRLVRWTEPEGTTSWTDDANGNVLTVTDGQGTITREYDALDRVVKYTGVSGKQLGYEYDEVGNLVTLTYPDGKSVRYAYDAARQLVKVVDWAGRETRYEYDGNGRLIKEIRPNGTVRSRRYDEVGRLTYQGEWDGAGKRISELRLSYDAVGNIVREERQPKLEGVELPAVTMSYAEGNELATYQGQTVRFDADGNLVWGPVRERMEELKFDSRNRLVEAGGVRYQYDAENQRIGMDGIRYVVNSQPLLSQVLVREEGGRETFYVYGLGLLGEEREGKYLSYHFDVRGSTIALSDENGEVVDRFGYGPYGELVSGDATQTPFLFNGQYGVMSDGNGLYYMRARFYSPLMKRFLNRDVVAGNVEEGQTLNRFAYVRGDPIKYTDPSGLDRNCGPGYRAVIDSTQPQVSYCVGDGSDPYQKICVNEECSIRGAPLTGPIMKLSYLLPFPHVENFPLISDITICSYYDHVASENKCNYHSTAAQICRGEFVPWSIAANSILSSCAVFGNHSIRQIKNCIRACLVVHDAVLRSTFPECKIACNQGACTQLNCIDAYHFICFERCGVSYQCYGGNYDDFIPPKWFYDE